MGEVHPGPEIVWYLVVIAFALGASTLFIGKGVTGRFLWTAAMWVTFIAFVIGLVLVA